MKRAHRLINFKEKEFKLKYIHISCQLTTFESSIPSLCMHVSYYVHSRMHGTKFQNVVKHHHVTYQFIGFQLWQTHF